MDGILTDVSKPSDPEPGAWSNGKNLTPPGQPGAPDVIAPAQPAVTTEKPSE